MDKMLFEDRCYRPDEVAEKLNVDVSTVYRMLRSVDNPMPSFRVTGTRVLRIRGLDANAYLEKNMVSPEDD